MLAHSQVNVMAQKRHHGSCCRQRALSLVAWPTIIIAIALFVLAMVAAVIVITTPILYNIGFGAHYGGPG